MKVEYSLKQAYSFAKRKQNSGKMEKIENETKD